jgi:FkbM family methyltransferase
MDLIERKAAEVARRGLMGYPTDDAEDLLRIDGISRILRCLVGVAELKLPGRDIVVPWDAALPAQLAYYVSIGDYENHDLDLAADFVRPGDRVMEMGGGVGITGVALAKASGAEVVIVEPNPFLHDAIRRTFAANGCAVRLVAAAAGAVEGTAILNVAPNYWWSSLEDRSGAETVEVRVAALEALVDEHRPDVLVVDIEGHETSFVGLPVADHVRCVLMEIHTPDIGTAATAKVASWLTDQGFRMADVRSYTWAFVRDR